MDSNLKMHFTEPLKQFPESANFLFLCDEWWKNKSNSNSMNNITINIVNNTRIANNNTRNHINSYTINRNNNSNTNLCHNVICNSYKGNWKTNKMDKTKRWGTD